MKKLTFIGLLIALFSGTVWAGPYEKYYRNLPVEMMELCL